MQRLRGFTRLQSPSRKWTATALRKSGKFERSRSGSGRSSQSGTMPSTACAVVSVQPGGQSPPAGGLCNANDRTRGFRSVSTAAPPFSAAPRASCRHREQRNQSGPPAPRQVLLMRLCCSLCPKDSSRDQLLPAVECNPCHQQRRAGGSAAHSVAAAGSAAGHVIKQPHPANKLDP